MMKSETYLPLLHQTLLGNTNYYLKDIYIPPSLDDDGKRTLSIHLGDGFCKWQPPQYDVPADIDFHKTLVTGFPAGDKRMVYLQMEALAGFPAKDEWDFAYLGMSNHPFIKGNYPHHEGIWGWGTAADQVVMMIPHIRRAMVEYHDILWDLGYATTWEEAFSKSDNLYERPPSDDEYYEWRDIRVLDEARWYGWFIDYWMEGGLRRDVFSHRLTTKEHWDDILLKPFYTRGELAYENYVSADTVVEPNYDPHCTNKDITDGCEPVTVISVDKLWDYLDGPDETGRIATALMNSQKTGQFVIDSQAWDCIWNELIQERKGPKIMTDRPGYKAMDAYSFSSEMLEEMIDELDRLISKYGSGDWLGKPTADRLVEILVEHRATVQTELNEVITGVRKLNDNDFLGPKERARRKAIKIKENGGKIDDDVDYSKYFSTLQQKRWAHKRRVMKGLEGVIDGTLDRIKDTLEQIREIEVAGGIDHDNAVALARSVNQIGNEIGETMPW